MSRNTGTEEQNSGGSGVRPGVLGHAVGLPPRRTLDTNNLLLSPRTRRRQRGRETAVLDNVTAAPALTNPPAVTPELLDTINAMLPPGSAVGSFHMNPSPDEMVIRQRGRRQVPLTFSPDVMSPQQRCQTRQHYQQLRKGSAHGHGGGGMARLLLPTRTSPRKRLTLGDDAPSPSSSSTTAAATSTGLATPPPLTRMSSAASLPGSDPAKLLSSSLLQSPTPKKLSKRQSPICKKLCLDESEASSSASSSSSSEVPPLVAMKGLSNAQLIELFGQIMSEDSSLEKRVSELMPQPDLGPMEEKLAHLKRNIFRTLPNTRLESRTDSLAFNRVHTHLLALKKAVTDQGKRLVDARQWASVVDHAVMAWGYVKGTPVWDNPQHNAVRRQCFKALASNCAQAVKQVRWDHKSAAAAKQRYKLYFRQNLFLAPTYASNLYSSTALFLKKCIVVTDCWRWTRTARNWLPASST